MPWRPARRAPTASAIVLATLLGGAACGGASSSSPQARASSASATPSPRATPTTPPPPTPAPTPLQHCQTPPNLGELVIPLPGFTISPKGSGPVPLSSIAPGGQAEFAAAGFVRGFHVHASSPSATVTLIVNEEKDPPSAGAIQRLEAKSDPTQQHFTTFPIDGIPGASGEYFNFPSTHAWISEADFTIAQVEVTSLTVGSADSPQLRASDIDLAQREYARVKQACGA